MSWNKPFKERIRHYYGLWIVNEDRREYTAAGNPRAPSLEVVLDWVDRAWSELSANVIRKSFKGGFAATVVALRSFPGNPPQPLACALSTPTDRTGDDEIACFKRDGPIGTRGLELLRAIRHQSITRDGRDDYEEAGLSYGDDERGDAPSVFNECANFDELGDDEDVVFG